MSENNVKQRRIVNPNTPAQVTKRIAYLRRAPAERKRLQKLKLTEQKLLDQLANIG